MTSIELIIKELLYRKTSSIIVLITAVFASLVFVSVYTLSQASENETRKIMREQGLNLYIFPKGTNLIDFFSAGNTATFPEKYVETLSESKTFDAVRHLTGILQVRYPDWRDQNGSVHQILCVGYKDEAMQRFLPQQEIMGTDVSKGTVQIGALVSRNIQEKAPFVINGKDGKKYSFVITKRLVEGMGMLDQGVAFNLSDLQQVMGMEGQINKIEALGCVCKDGRIKNARKQVQAIFPDLEVTELYSIAEARENQRIMMNRYGAFIIPFILISCLIITGLLFYQNVNIRRHEIGLLKAMGRSTGSILSIILAKAFILGLAGTFLGCFLGTIVAEYFGREIFSFTAFSIKPLWNLFVYTVIIFPLLWMVAAWVPALIASQIDAAKTLSEE
jgi:putative ABC transport system permease protein